MCIHISVYLRLTRWICQRTWRHILSTTALPFRDGMHVLFWQRTSPTPPPKKKKHSLLVKGLLRHIRLSSHFYESVSLGSCIICDKRENLWSKCRCQLLQTFHSIQSSNNKTKKKSEKQNTTWKKKKKIRFRPLFLLGNCATLQAPGSRTGAFPGWRLRLQQQVCPGSSSHWLARYLHSAVVITAYPAQPRLRRTAELALEFCQVCLFVGRRTVAASPVVRKNQNVLCTCWCATSRPMDRTQTSGFRCSVEKIHAFISDGWVIAGTYIYIYLYIFFINIDRFFFFP